MQPLGEETQTFCLRLESRQWTESLNDALFSLFLRLTIWSYPEDIGIRSRVRSGIDWKRCFAKLTLFLGFNAVLVESDGWIYAFCLLWLVISILIILTSRVPLCSTCWEWRYSPMLSWHLFTDIFTPRSRVLPEKLIGPQLVKKFPAFLGTRRFITAFTTARYLSLSWARAIYSTHPSHFSKIHFNILLLFTPGSSKWFFLTLATD
jgi:hypothetical protein